MLLQKPISHVSQSNLFDANSRYFGFSPDKTSLFALTLYDLACLWETQGYIEIYTDDKDQKWGRLKSSSYDGRGRYIQAYAHLYHGRVQDDSLAKDPEEKAAMQDPLIVVTFQPSTDSQHDVAVMEFILNHNQYVGRTGKGKGPVNLDRIRSGVLSRINLARSKFL